MLDKKENYGIIASGIISHSHSSLFPQKGQLQSQYNNACLQDRHFVYSAKSSFKLSYLPCLTMPNKIDK